MTYAGLSTSAEAGELKRIGIVEVDDSEG